MTYFEEEDGRTRICRADGCAPDFLTQLAVHQEFLLGYLAPHHHLLDGSLASLIALGAELDKRKDNQLPLPRPVIDGITAYCGEVIRAHAGGEWAMRTLPPDKWGGPRYFPYVITVTEQVIDFAGCIEGDAAEAKACSFPYRIRARLAPPFQVVPWCAHPLGNETFPPLLPF